MHGTKLHPGIEVRATAHGRGLFATRPIPAGRAILPVVGRPRPKPDRLSVQIGPDLHLAPGGAPWALANHACRPSCRIDFATWRLASLRPIGAGDELTWDYSPPSGSSRRRSPAAAGRRGAAGRSAASGT